jgi:iron(III) transport system substrate-binding protein
MFKKQTIYILMITLLIVAVSLSACAPAATPAPEEPQVEEAAPVEALEATDKLVVYSPNSEGLLNSTIPVFEEMYGVEVEVISAGTGELIKRLQGEKNNPYCDVMYGGNYATYLINKDLFQDYVSPNEKNVMDSYKNKLGFSTTYVLDGSVLLVNKNLIGDIEIKGYKDLLNPELKGKIISANPTLSSSAYAHLTNMLNAMGNGDYMTEEAWKYVEELYANTIVIDSSSAVWKGVRDGEYTVGLSYEDPAVTLVRDGADVEVVYMEEGVVFLPATSAVIKGAKNLLNAQRFIDLILSEEIQNAFGTQLTNRPVMTNVKTPDYMTPFLEINVIEEDQQFTYEHKQEILDRWTAIFVANQ